MVLEILTLPAVLISICYMAVGMISGSAGALLLREPSKLHGHHILIIPALYYAYRFLRYASERAKQIIGHSEDPASRPGAVIYMGVSTRLLISMSIISFAVSFFTGALIFGFIYQPQ